MRHKILQRVVRRTAGGAQRAALLVALTIGAALAVAACSGSSETPVAEEAAPQQAAQPTAQEEAAQPAAAQPAEPQAQAPAEPEQQTAEPPAQEEPAAQSGGDDGVVYDPNRDTLNEGERFGSSVQTADEVKQFRFAAQEGEWLRISVDGRDGMDPILTILQPDRTDIARNDDRSATNRDSLLVVQIPSSGEQVIRVGAFDAASLGDFIIQVERLEVGSDVNQEIISFGVLTPGRLDFPNDVDEFEFNGRAGQTVTIVVDGDLDVDVYSQLLNPEGNWIAGDDDSGHGLDAEMSLTLEQDGLHRIEVWPALNLEGQRQLIGAYNVIVREQPATGALDERTAGDTAGVALTFLDALRQGDSATILALAGPEALTMWGWQNTADVDRDLEKMRSIGLGGNVRQSVARSDTLNEGRARVYLQFADDDWLRFELTSVGGLWTVDFWSHQTAAPRGAQTAAELQAEAETAQEAAAESESESDAQAEPTTDQTDETEESGDEEELSE